MTTCAHTFTNLGLKGCHIWIEADSNNSLPTLDIIGLPDTAVKEARERMRMAFKNCGVKLPPKKIVINLAPSDVKKEGTKFDLAMATAILLLTVSISKEQQSFFEDTLCFGELGLDGSVRKVQGLLPCIVSAYRQGWTSFIVPRENKAELQYIPGIRLYFLTNFLQLVDMCTQGIALPFLDTKVGTDAITAAYTSQESKKGFSGVQGHSYAKRALTIAAAGMHNTLLIGPPGSGKTMLSKAMHSLLPTMTFDQILEVSQLHSLVGLLHAEKPLCTQRPWRMVHHTASKISIVGGGKYLTPGEVSLAHHGILFFDELPEFPREVLEVLRQPLEDRTITISRAQGSVTYPASFMFMATMNPCKCGYFKDPHKPCICSLNDVKRYQTKISGPLLDRFDMILEIPRQDISLTTKSDELTHEDLEEYASCVTRAREIQRLRYADTSISINAAIPAGRVSAYINMAPAAIELLQQAARQFHLSPRVVHRMMRVGRTIADIAGSQQVGTSHIAEALQYRAKSMLLGV